MAKSLIISKEHGVNPSLTCCPICGKEVGIALFGKLKGDAKAPTHVVGTEPCDECKDKLDNGKIAIMEAVFNNDVSLPSSLIRTGRYTFIDEKAIKVEIPNKIAVMRKEEFTKLFGTN